MKSFLINLINKYVNLGEHREDNCWNFANINILYIATVLSYFWLLNTIMFMLHITERVKIWNNTFIVLFYCELIEKWKIKKMGYYIKDILKSMIFLWTRYDEISPLV